MGGNLGMATLHPSHEQPETVHRPSLSGTDAVSGVRYEDWIDLEPCGYAGVRR